MSLSCTCDYYEDYDWWYIPPNDYRIFKARRRKRCSSCHELIEMGESIARFQIARPTKYELEDNIFGEDGEVPMADKLFCEKCADLYFSLSELGFSCIAPTENMYELAKEYHKTYGRKNE